MEKRRCLACGQVISKREIALYRGLLQTLFRVYKYVESRGNGYLFTRKEIKHLFRNENDTARFGDLILFGGLVFKESKAHYGLNLERCAAFFYGDLRIPTRIWKDPLTNELAPLDPMPARAFPDLKALLDSEGAYISNYKD